MGLTGAGIIASVVGILGGVSLSCGGWSSLSLGARSLFVTTQFLSAFAMYVACHDDHHSCSSNSVKGAQLGCRYVRTGLF